MDKYGISATGSIKYKLEGKTAKFKHNLDTEVKINVSNEVVTTTKEENNLEIIIDPMTVANLRILGEASVTNGVAAYYIFWFLYMYLSFSVSAFCSFSIDVN